MTIPEIIVGVPLPMLGEVKEEKEELQETTKLGKPTGRRVTVRRVFLHTSRGRFLIGSNEGRLGDQYKLDQIDYGVEDEDGEISGMGLPVDYWHKVSEGSTAEDILVGVALPEKERYMHDWHPLFSIIDPQTVTVTMQKAAASLYDQFGYAGPVYLLVPAICGDG